MSNEGKFYFLFLLEIWVSDEQDTLFCIIVNTAIIPHDGNFQSQKRVSLLIIETIYAPSSPCILPVCYTINMPTYLNIPVKTVSGFLPVMGQTLLQALP